jgi:epoxyqueuosine reductase
VNEDLATALKTHALEELGFDLVGITSAEPLAGRDHLARWLAAGAQGEMRYMTATAAVRGDPRRFLPGARSVVCVAMSYHDAHEAPELPPWGRRVVVARYARRSDYHKVIRHRVVRLGRFLGARRPGATWRPAVDTAPLLEKELAQRAGLGWIGKNTCLINRSFGSELLLGELVTDVELPIDRPAEDHCGTCTACLEACPSRAITAPRRLDARRCISYLTIEHRSELPPVLLPALGAHLAGCDVCQAVCPWNRHAPQRCAAPLAARKELAGLTVDELLALDEEGWRTLTAGTPLRRLDWARFRRNLAAAARNLSEEPLERPATLTLPTHRTITRAAEGPGRLPEEV